MHVPLWGWLAFLAVIVACFAVDLLLGHRGDRAVTLREAAGWSLGWLLVGLAFTGVVGWLGGGPAAGEYLTGFLVEKSLSVDNVFVFALLFSYFAVPAVKQHRVLLYGVLGALVLRGVFIAAGASLLAAFSWTVFVLGGLLVVTGLRMATHDGGEVHPDRNPMLKLVRRIAPNASPLVPVLVAVATTDVLFAVDSVPAVFAITRDTFIVFAANAFSVLGLRPMYFLLADAMHRFWALRFGLAAVLVFVGAKMLLADVIHLSPWVSLLVVLSLLGVALLVSLRPRERARSRRAPIAIRMHPSVVVVVALVALVLGTSVLPQQVTGLPGWAHGLAGAAGAALLLGSILGHELSHALVARRHGLVVTSVTLWALGGVARVEGLPPGPGAAFRIAAVGPLVSGLLGAAMLGAAYPLGGLTGAVLGWVGVANLVLAGFNLLPGAPLDGGRMLWAVLWRRTGDRGGAARAAARAGRFVGLGLIVLGAVQVALGSLVGGLWLALVGWFLTGTAALEGARAQLDGALDGLRVADVMTPADPAPGWLTVAAFLDRVAGPSGAAVFPLVGFDGQPAGVVRLAALTAVPEPDRAGLRTVAAALPLSAVGTAAPDEPAGVLAERMAPAGLVLVLAGGEVRGYVEAAALARAADRRTTATVSASAASVNGQPISSRTAASQPTDPAA